MEPAFYREFAIFMECGSRAAAFLPCEPSKEPEAIIFPEIDIPPDTLESSHAYS
jgi:hypothetical protein